MILWVATLIVHSFLDVELEQKLFTNLWKATLLVQVRMGFEDTLALESLGLTSEENTMF